MLSITREKRADGVMRGGFAEQAIKGEENPTSVFLPAIGKGGEGNEKCSTQETNGGVLERVNKLRSETHQAHENLSRMKREEGVRGGSGGRELKRTERKKKRTDVEKN